MPASDGPTKYTIIKEGSDPAFNGQDASTRVATITAPRPPMGMPSGPGFGGRRHRVRRSTKTFPRGILRKTAKIVPSKNPSKAPATRKRSVKLMTEKGLEKARKTAKTNAAKMDITLIRKKLVEKKIIGEEKKNVPPSVLRVLYADSVGAGLLS
jgi:hypothetical protein